MKNFRVKMWTAVAILVTLVMFGADRLAVFTTGTADNSVATLLLAQNNIGGESPNSNNIGGESPNPNNIGGNPGGTSLTNPLGVNSIEEFLLKILDVILIFATPIIVLFIMYAGFLYVTARGDETKIKTAHAALTWSIVGGVIVLGAQLILSVLTGTINAF